jgi:biotin carboxylase
MQKRVLFLGGAYAQIPIIQEAKNRGWYIITCDYLPDNPGHKLSDEYHNVSTTDFEGVLELAMKVKPDFVIAYASDPAAPTAAYVSEKLGLPGNSYKSVQLLSEKDLFRKFLIDNGFNAPKCISIIDDNDIENVILLKFPIIIKPTDSSGSKGVSKINSRSEIKQAIEYALIYSRNKRVIAEEYIECEGPQLHGDGFVIDGELVFDYLGDHHYNKDVNPFVPFSTTWPSIKGENVISQIEKELKRAISLSGFKNGAVNIEVRTSKTGDIYIMEIGPRSGGNFVPQVINFATNFDMISASLDLFENKEIIIKNIQKKHAAYYVLHSERDGILRSISVSKELQNHIKEFHQYVQPGGKVYSFQGANAAIGVLLLIFNSHKEMDFYIENMYRFVEIQIEK